MNKLNLFLQRWDSKFGYNSRDPIKKVFKSLARRIPPEIIQRILTYSLLESRFKEIETITQVHSRKEVWDCAIKSTSPGSIVYLEFGVYLGDSISYFAKSNISPSSRFIGLDSFNGLPESWAGNPAGYFSTAGKVPLMNDTRVTFLVGYFQEIWTDEIVKRLSPNLIVHFDADLYSSTLFALTRLDELEFPYLAIFDEFTGDELRALNDYILSHNASVEFICRQDWRDFPEVVLCKIFPRNAK